jgi:hypothetical protein
LRPGLVEQLCWRHQLFLVVCTEGNGPRLLPPRDQWASMGFTVNPDVSVQVETRNLRGRQHVGRITYTLRSRTPVHVTGLSASVLLSLKDQTTCFKGKRLIDQLKDRGIDRNGAFDVIAEFLDREILYAPHASEV